MSHDSVAIRRLLAGVRAFRARYYEARPERLRPLVEGGQTPQVLMIACADSRVDPALLTDAEPGELFVVRNVANLVPPHAPDTGLHGTSAAIEFAVRDLLVEHIVVLGHAGCGGIRALIEGDHEEREFIDAWVAIARAAADKGGHDHAAVERAAVAGSLDNLLTFPWIRERHATGALQIHGWWFDLEAGELWYTEPGAEDFRPLGLAQG